MRYMENESTKQSFLQRLNIRNVSIGLALVVVLGAGLGYRFYTKAKSSQDSQAVAKQEAQQLVATIEKLMVLPTDELPIVATVADPSKLQDQPFFANAKKGDKVLIYNTAKKAILYDPANNLIIDVAPLSIGSQPSPTPAQ
jgi:hypothetical protein